MMSSEDEESGTFSIHLLSWRSSSFDYIIEYLDNKIMAIQSRKAKRQTVKNFARPSFYSMLA